MNKIMKPIAEPFRMPIILLTVVVAGLSQGLLLPLLTILLEDAGVSSGMNGFNAAGMYIGSFLAMFVIERPVRRFGYKRVLIAGLLLDFFATLCFPFWTNMWGWFLLRFLVGIGNSSLHFSAQLWILTSCPEHKKGRYISFYGMAYGIGFCIGPAGINLLQFGRWAPFAAVLLFYAAVLFLLLKLPEEAASAEKENKEKTVQKRYSQTLRIAWFALIPAFLYGFMEAVLNSNFALYGLRIGLGESVLSLLLPVIGIGGLVLQLPLGMLSDRIGRKKVLLAAGIIGGLCFLLVPLAGGNPWLIGLCLFVAGGLVGSFFSLGLAYASDLLPKVLLPTANVIASINHSLGSVAGPNLGGLSIQYISLSSLFWMLGGIYLIFAFAGFWFKGKKEPVQQEVPYSPLSM